MKTVLTYFGVLIGLSLPYFLVISLGGVELFLVILLSLAILVPLILCWKYYYIGVYFTPLKSGENDNTAAVGNFLEQIKNTKKNLQIFDDGNSMGESIYNNQKVIDALQDKIRNKNISISIHFNCKDELLINKLAKKYENVEIKYNPKERKKEDHFRISDGGKYCYISSHGYDEEKRNYNIYQKSSIDLPFFNFEKRYANHPIVNCKKTFELQAEFFKS